jgi:hypothetical protein
MSHKPNATRIVVRLIGACALLLGIGLLLAGPSAATPAAPASPVPTPAVVDDANMTVSESPSYGIGDAISTSRAVPSYGIGDAISTSRAVPSLGTDAKITTARHAAKHAAPRRTATTVDGKAGTPDTDGVARTGGPIVNLIIGGLLLTGAGAVVYYAARRWSKPSVW